MKSKLYAIKDGEYEQVYPLNELREMIDFEISKEVEVEEFEIDRESEFFWCMDHGELYWRREEGECGVYCSDYEPRNGKSGCCKWWRHPYKKNGNVLKLRREEK